MSSTAGSPDSSPEAELEAQLLAAHAVDDGAVLSVLYERAADLSELSDDTERACFYLTQAYILALEMGLPYADSLEKRLRRQGRI